jgi:DNA-binding SARP family transcriptional activator/tetratricopeptide (TPR) repeat protein
MPVVGEVPAGGVLAVGLLGPVEIGPAGGVMSPVPQPRLRALLGLLSVAEGRVVSAEALVDGVWGEEWSPRRERNLHALVYQLRRRLAGLEPDRGGTRLARAGAGYRLILGPGELDTVAFRDLAGRARDAARAGDTMAARVLFGQALGLWRGAALADAAPLCARLAGEAARLEEARLAVVEERIGCDLALGRNAEVAGELSWLVGEFPLRERLAVLMMTALYRCGRRGEALAAYDNTRRVLAEQLGLDPGPELAGLQAQVLADDPALAAPAAVPGGAGPAMAVTAAGTVPRQLPAGARFFAGREAELRELDALLGQAGDQDRRAGSGDDGPVVITAVAGMAGVGKTALAVHWARRVAGLFPDGQLYVNLRGYGPGAAVAPEEAAGWFLVALGVPASQIPAGVQARYGLYRSVLAGRRVLIVLDNARDAGQVRPLLPGGGRCLVVVTSRSALAGLAAAEGARPLRLGPLSDQEAVRLLAARLGPERVAAEPDAVTELISRCGHLPLALAVMGARAAADPGLPLRVLAGQLAAAPDAGAPAGGQPPGSDGGRLDVLETGDAATSLRELLSWSHRQLTVPSAQIFALLGVHCGPDITVPAAASLAGVPRADTRRALAELADASLAAEHRPGRYVLHDLVRGYAAGHAQQALGEAGIREAIGRSLDHYLHTALPWYEPPPPFTAAPPARGVVPEHLAGEAGLADWMLAEHQVLLRATVQAAAAGLITQAWQIMGCQGWFLTAQGYWTDFHAAGQAVLAAAEAAADQAALGWAHAWTGWYGTFIGAHDDGRVHLRQALDHFRLAGDLPGRAWAHLFGTRPAARKGDWAEAAGLAGQALELFRQAGDNYGERSALAQLGECHARLGNYDLARSYARQAIGAASEAGDPTNLAFGWNVLGSVHSRLGQHRQAITCYRQALALARQRQTRLARRWLASLLARLGDACQAAGDLPAACQAWQQALQIRNDLGLPDNRRIRGRLEQASPPSRPG